MPKKEINLEEALSQLNKIIESLNDPSVSIDDSLKLYEEGVKLIRACRTKIEKAKQKIKYIDELEENTNE